MDPLRSRSSTRLFVQFPLIDELRQFGSFIDSLSISRLRLAPGLQTLLRAGWRAKPEPYPRWIGRHSELQLISPRPRHFGLFRIKAIS